MMGHGGGGALTGKLIKDLILAELGNPILNKLDDSACLDIADTNLVFTTDSYVIDPIFFPVRMPCFPVNTYPFPSAIVLPV